MCLWKSWHEISSVKEAAIPRSNNWPLEKKKIGYFNRPDDAIVELLSLTAVLIIASRYHWLEGLQLRVEKHEKI